MIPMDGDSPKYGPVKKPTVVSPKVPSRSRPKLRFA